MPRKGYSLQERDRVREALLREGRRVFAAKGFKDSTLNEVFESVGISKTFFYRFFTTKGQFARDVVCYQQPLIAAFLRETMTRPGDDDFRSRLRKFYLDVCDPKSGFFVPMIQDFQSMRHRATTEELVLYRECLRSYAVDLMAAMSIPKGEFEPSIFFNMFMHPMLVRFSIGGTYGLCEPLSHVDEFECVTEALADFLVKHGAKVTQEKSEERV